MRVVYNPQVEVVANRKIHLAHGDNMNIGGQPMLRFMNALFRSSVARWMFRWLIHPDIALRLGRKFSGKSRKSHGMELPSESVLDPLVEYAEAHHREHADVQTYIFGHMHIPGRRVVDGADVLFLSDWSREVATYAQMDGNGVELKRFNIDETIS
jgi:UDP-2,3-diacylglucosamine hydrolase